MPLGSDFEIDDPGFKAWVRGSGGGGSGPRGGGGSGGGGGFPSLGGSSVLGSALSGSSQGGLAGALRRRPLGGMAGALTPTVATSLPTNAQGLSTVPTMSMYGTAAGGRGINGPMPVQPMTPPVGTPGYGGGGRGRGGHGGGRGTPPVGTPGAPPAVEWNPEALVKWLMSNAEKSGVFDVNGNPMLARMARENIMGDAGARESAARTAAMLHAGNDPSMAGFASLMSGLNTAGQASGAASDAALKSAYDNQAFMRDLVSRFAGPKQEQQGGSGWADILGPIAGALVGAVL